MADELLSVLSADAEAVDRSAPPLHDRELSSVYEALLLMRELDDRLADLQEAGALGLWVPAAEASVPAAGLAAALAPDDWLYPSFRDQAAYLVRGGSLRHLVAQALGAANDLQQGRALAGQVSLSKGRYVPATAGVGAQLLRASGTALAIRARGAATVVAALTGAAAVEMPPFWMGLQNATRHRAPLVVLCRTPEGSALEPARRAKALDLATERVDGADLLAVIKAARDARDRALEGAGGTLIEAVVPRHGADDDSLARLRPWLEHRGLSDPGREAELTERCRERVREAIEAARAAGPATRSRTLEDVTAEAHWILEEQRQSLLGDDS